MNNLYDENLQYLRNFVGQDSVDRYIRIKCNNQSDFISQVDWNSYSYITECLKAMDGFGDTRWWLSNDKCYIAFYQLQTHVPLVSPNVFYDALHELFNRTISPYEVTHNKRKLIEEAISILYSSNSATKKVIDYINMAQKS